MALLPPSTAPHSVPVPLRPPSTLQGEGTVCEVGTPARQGPPCHSAPAGARGAAGGGSAPSPIVICPSSQTPFPGTAPQKQAGSVPRPHASPRAFFGKQGICCWSLITHHSVCGRGRPPWPQSAVQINGPKHDTRELPGIKEFLRRGFIFPRSPSLSWSGPSTKAVLNFPSHFLCSQLVSWAMLWGTLSPAPAPRHAELRQWRVVWPPRAHGISGPPGSSAASWSLVAVLGVVTHIWQRIKLGQSQLLSAPPPPSTCLVLGALWVFLEMWCCDSGQERGCPALLQATLPGPAPQNGWGAGRCSPETYKGLRAVHLGPTTPSPTP